MKRALQIATVVLLVSAALAQDYLTGTVKSNDGKPLAGVLVWDNRKGSAKTDSEGAFRIERTEPVLFFSLDGYEPVAVVLAKDKTEVSVTMADSAGKTWVIPNCKDKPPQSSGLNLRYAIPKDAKIKVTTDSDYSKRWVRYPHGKKKESLVIWEGGEVSFGHPTPEDFVDASSYQERSISYENSGRIGGAGDEDARGVVKSGGLWRWAGGFGQFATYWGVSPEAAAYFDQIIDGMCNEGFPASTAREPPRRGSAGVPPATIN